MKVLDYKKHKGFNTQPRGGGCQKGGGNSPSLFWFQHTAARRRLQWLEEENHDAYRVSTHSRAEAAAFANSDDECNSTVSTHSRAEAAAIGAVGDFIFLGVSTHSRAEAAAQLF